MLKRVTLYFLSVWFICGLTLISGATDKTSKKTKREMLEITRAQQNRLKHEIEQLETAAAKLTNTDKNNGGVTAGELDQPTPAIREERGSDDAIKATSEKADLSFALPAPAPEASRVRSGDGTAMQNFVNSILLLVVLGLGSAVMCLFYYLIYGMLFVLWYKTFGAPESSESYVSLSSVPAMLDAETVFEYVREIHEESKRIAYVKLLDSTKRLLTELSKRPASYPEDKLTFALGQLKSQIARSPVADSLETIKFRKLATTFIENELSKGAVC